MPVITVIDINPAHPDARRELADVCCMHARVLAATDPQHNNQRTLWALLPGPRLLIRAHQPVNPDLWPNGYVRGITHQPWTPPPAGRTEGVVIVNPVQRTSRETGKPKARALPDSHVPDWLAGKLAAAGIYTTIIDVTHSREVGGWRQGARVSHRVAVCRVSADVIDPDAAERLTTAGVGRAKAYGCGISMWWPR